MDELRAQLYRQATIGGREGVDPSSHTVAGFDQYHGSPRFRQGPGCSQPGNAGTDHNHRVCFAWRIHSQHLPGECLGARTLCGQRMIESLDGQCAAAASDRGEKSKLPALDPHRDPRRRVCLRRGWMRERELHFPAEPA